MIGTETAVEWMPIDVLGVEVVRIWEVVEGSDVAVLLSISVFIEVVIVPDVSVFTVELKVPVDGGKVLVPDRGVG